MKTIEIIGPLGSGKTTLCAALSRSCCSQDSWIPFKEASLRWAFKDSKWHKRRLARFRLFEKIFLKHRRSRHIDAVDPETIARFIEQWPNFPGPCIRELQKLYPAFPNWYLLHFRLMQRCSILQRLSETPGPAVLWDEGLLHSILFAIDCTEEILQMAPPPTAILWLLTPADIIVHRRMSRSSAHDLAFNKLDPDVRRLQAEKFNERTSACARFYERQGVPVLRIDGSLSVEENVTKMQNFLRDIIPLELPEQHQSNVRTLATSRNLPSTRAIQPESPRIKQAD